MEVYDAAPGAPVPPPQEAEVPVTPATCAATTSAATICVASTSAATDCVPSTSAAASTDTQVTVQVAGAATLPPRVRIGVTTRQSTAFNSLGMLGYPPSDTESDEEMAIVNEMRRDLYRRHNRRLQ